MNQVKNCIRKSFTMIPNMLIEDNQLSDRARFLFIYLGSKPDNWTFYNKQLCKSLKYSQDTLRKYINELETKGWIKRITRNRRQGKFTSNLYIIHESPIPKIPNSDENYRIGNFPTRKKTDSGKNRLGKTHTHSNTNYKQKEYISNTYLKEKENNSKKINANPRLKL